MIWILSFIHCRVLYNLNIVTDGEHMSAWQPRRFSSQAKTNCQKLLAEHLPQRLQINQT